MIACFNKQESCSIGINHSPPREQTPDVHVHEDELAEGTSSLEDDQVPNPLEQGPPGSPQVETLDLDGRADTPHPKRESSPTPL